MRSLLRSALLALGILGLCGAARATQAVEGAMAIQERLTVLADAARLPSDAIGIVVAPVHPTAPGQRY